MLNKSFLGPSLSLSLSQLMPAPVATQALRQIWSTLYEQICAQVPWLCSKPDLFPSLIMVQPQASTTYYGRHRLANCKTYWAYHLKMEFLWPIQIMKNLVSPTFQISSHDGSPCPVIKLHSAKITWGPPILCNLFFFFFFLGPTI